MGILASSDFTGATSDPWPSEWTFAASSGGGSATIDSNRGKQVTTAIGGYSDWIAYRMNFGTTQDGIYTGTFMVTNVSNEAYGEVYFRGDTDLLEGDTYLLSLEPAGSLIQFGKYTAGSYSSPIGSTSAYTFVNNTPANWKVQFEGTSLKAKVWTGTEPGTWDLSVTDSSFTAAGYVGLGLFGGSAATARTAYWDSAVLDDGLLSSPPLQVIQRPNRIWRI